MKLDIKLQSKNEYTQGKGKIQKKGKDKNIGMASKIKN